MWDRGDLIKKLTRTLQERFISFCRKASCQISRFVNLTMGKKLELIVILKSLSPMKLI